MFQPDKVSFYQDVYSVVKEIPRGKVISYGEIARLIGWEKYSRMAGKAMSQVPAALKLPCHRVVNSSGRTVPGWEEQRMLLEKEGVLFRANGCVDMKKCGWKWEEDL
jgi:O-6-methylguanine DNA methyltransferase